MPRIIDPILVYDDSSDKPRELDQRVPVAPVASQNLDHTNIDVLLEQVRGEAVSQRVWRNPIGQSSQLGSHVAAAVELSRRHRVDAVAAREHPHLWLCDAPPVAQQLQQLR